MSGNRIFRSAMKKLLEPKLAHEGFTGKYPHFRRSDGEVLHLLSVIYDKWGGGFVLEFAAHPPGPLNTSWGTVVPEAELDVAYASPDLRARLVPSSDGGLKNEFFRYEEIRNNKQLCEQLVASVVEAFPQVNEWLRHKSVGPNIKPFAP